jgi:hypothetical protein
MARVGRGRILGAETEREEKSNAEARRAWSRGRGRKEERKKGRKEERKKGRKKDSPQRTQRAQRSQEGLQWMI